MSCDLFTSAASLLTNGGSGGVSQVQVRCTHTHSAAHQARHSQASVSLRCRSAARRKEEVPVFFLNHPAGHVLTLGCPGARPNMAVAWDQESKPLYRSEHPAGGDVGAPPPRLQIDMGHHLVFNPAEIKDSGNDAYVFVLKGRVEVVGLVLSSNVGSGRSLSKAKSRRDALVGRRAIAFRL